ncbi:hypothetical protein [Hyphomicrobium sp.]
MLPFNRKKASDKALESRQKLLVSYFDARALQHRFRVQIAENLLE